MAFTFNKRLFNLFGNGNGFQSSMHTKASDTGVRALELSRDLTKYLPADDTPPGAILPTEFKVVDCQAALVSFAAGANQMAAHINGRLDTLLDDMQVSVTIKEIDSYINNVPSSCATIDSVMGSLGNVGDMYLDAVTSELDDLEQAMADFDLKIITVIEFDDILVRVTEELKSATSGILGMIAGELSTISGMYQKMHQLANSFAIESLINDPCVRPLLKKLADPELTNVLTEDFGLDDLPGM
ncbi:hypothetical protein M3I01_013480 [Marinomonas sp. RSW2]|uniref:DUF7217 domain-containing protein n=1 Tax=Marinomonas maritima TaxID=2940935 RepID=A0ABT5WGG0_9GAMM|nr:hypothetical protein [Marinomonas maritima]MDE8603909.1 hypothetical protein [Marinomonas maritima]